MSSSDFIQKMTPFALDASAKTGVDPRIILAQAANETGYGAHAPGNNYFGIKGPGQTLQTTEVVDGQSVPQAASFRGYDSPAASFGDYAAFLNKNPRYAPMRNAQGLDAQVSALGQSGYATDPDYAAKVGKIAHSIDLGDGTTPFAPPAPLNLTGSAPAAAPAAPADLASMFTTAAPAGIDPTTALALQANAASAPATVLPSQSAQAQADLAARRKALITGAGLPGMYG